MPNSRLRIIALVFVAVALSMNTAFAVEHAGSQSDWSAGPGETSAVVSWASGFADTEGLSWRAIPGQLALASAAVAVPRQHTVDGNASGAIKVVAADLDDDGDTDVVSVGYYSHRITVYWNLGGSPPSWQAEVLDDGITNAAGLSTADVDGDGRTDVLATAGGLSEVSWWRNLGGSPAVWERRAISSPYPAGHDVVVADVDGDGAGDVLVPFLDDDAILYWLNEGGDPVAFREQTLDEGMDYPTKLAICDIDNDGDLDVASAMWLDEDVAWWRNDGGSPITWVRQEVAAGLTGVHWVACADMNDDGWNDLLAASMNLSQITLWRHSGEEEVSWRRSAVTSALVGAVSTVPADLDGDGDLDVLGGGWAPNGGASWFENRGGATSWNRHIVDAGFGETSSVHVSDVDGDGDLDALATSWTTADVAWWEISDFVEHGTLTSSILDTGGVTGWLSYEIDGLHVETPALEIEARAGDDSEAMGPWRALSGNDLSNLDGDGQRYLQYRVTMQRTTEGESPILRDIQFRWEAPRRPCTRRPRARVTP